MSDADRMYTHAEVEAQVAPLRDEIAQKETLLKTMDHFAEVAETCERKSNEWAAKLRDHELANGGCVPKPAYDDLAEAHRAAESALRQVREAVREFADSRGVNVGDEDTDWYAGYRHAQREALQDAAAFARAVLDWARVGAADTQPEGAGDDWAERVANIWRDSPKTRAALTERYSGLAWALDHLAYPEVTPTAGGKVDTAPEAAPRALGFCPRCGSVVGIMHTQPECDALYDAAYRRALPVKDPPDTSWVTEVDGS